MKIIREHPDKCAGFPGEKQCLKPARHRHTVRGQGGEDDVYSVHEFYLCDEHEEAWKQLTKHD